MTISRLKVIAFFFLITFGLPHAIYAQEVIRPAGKRIVGGEPVDIKDHPWQVALNIKTSLGTSLCGGSIIAHKWVLTAAHCFKGNTTPLNVKVKAGATDYQTNGGWTAIERVIVHVGYDPITQVNDIALVKLRRLPSGRVIPFMDKKTNINIGEPLEVTGWGTTSENGNISSQLRKAIVPYITNATCNSQDVYKGHIGLGMLCAGHPDGGIDACQGDSGGPLVMRGPDGPVLVGIVSWGEGCARKLKYGVYTRVNSYHDWINGLISSNSN